MRVLWPILLLLIGCAHAPQELSYLDQATIECLDWAWSQESDVEVAGGVILTAAGIECSPLTWGTRLTVTHAIPSEYLTLFHTHTIRAPFSPTDREAYRLDPYARPSYMREPGGAVWVYEGGWPRRLR
ncbi:MAG: hypothetical protein V3S01_09345 [Dehalococcoidia bacterium]